MIDLRAALKAHDEWARLKDEIGVDLSKALERAALAEAEAGRLSDKLNIQAAVMAGCAAGMDAAARQEPAR